VSPTTTVLARTTNNMNKIKSVLQVDDDVFMHKLVQYVFEDIGVGLTSVCTGNECMNCLLEKTPDLLLIDINLDGESGQDLAAKVFEVKPSLPVIFLSGSRLNQEDCIVENVLGSIRKPFNPDTLISQIESLRQLQKEFESTQLPITIEAIESLRQIVHKLAGSSGIYGFTDLSVSASQLELCLDDCICRDNQSNNLQLPRLPSLISQVQKEIVKAVEC